MEKVIKHFKPNLINGGNKSFNLIDRLNKDKNIKDYLSTTKKDGCRLTAGISDVLLSRSLKPIKSVLVNERFEKLNQLCLKLNIVIDGEFYMHGAKMNEIFRFFSAQNVESPGYRKKLERQLEKSPSTFKDIHGDRTIDWLCTFHEGLKFWIFDGMILDRPEVVSFEDRIRIIYERLEANGAEDLGLVFSRFKKFNSIEKLQAEYDNAIANDWEGLVLCRKDSPYYFGKPSITRGWMYKMKDDKREYDGVIISLIEGTNIKEGVARGVNELGRSTTSGKKEDREPNGKCSGFEVQYEGVGTFKVGLRGFNDEDKKFILKNPEKFLGRSFVYDGMKPLKDFPRHAHFLRWRDSK